MRLIKIAAVLTAFAMLNGCGEDTKPVVKPEYISSPPLVEEPRVDSELPSSETGYKPDQFKTVQEMFENFNDYSSMDGTFKLISEEPLHIQLSPNYFTVANDTASQEDGLKRTLVTGVYQSFIHTPIERITVTARPVEVDIDSGKFTYPDKPVYTVTITRQQALALLKKHVDADSFDDLVSVAKVDDIYFPAQLTVAFDRIRFSDRSPGLKTFFDDLITYQ